MRKIRHILAGIVFLSAGYFTTANCFTPVNYPFISLLLNLPNITGVFSDIPYYGEAGNYTEAQEDLWDVFEDDGDMAYGIYREKPYGGIRRSIINDEAPLPKYNSVSADVKLYKRPSAINDYAWWEDCRLFWGYRNDTTFAFAHFSNTPGLKKEPTIGQKDAFGISGFVVYYNGAEYRLTHSDKPEDPILEIPAETCIPYEDDESFNDWNRIRVQVEDSVLSMVVNSEIYHSVDLDTLVCVEYYEDGYFIGFEPAPDEVIEMLMGYGQVGIGSFNDRVSFDSVEAVKDQLILSTEHISCHGMDDGVIDMIVNYGTPPYSILWSTGDTTETIDSLPAGMYTVEVTDAADSIVKDTAWIIEPDTLVAFIYDSTGISYHGFQDGAAKAVVSGGTMPWQFIWDDPCETKDTVVSTLTGERHHHFVVTDKNGCIASDSVFIEGSDSLFVEIIANKEIICFNEPVGSARAVAHYADYPVIYQWDDPGGTIDSVLTGIEPGVYYRIHVTDASGRVGCDSIILAQTDSISLDSLFIGDVTGCYGDENGWIAVVANIYDPPSVQFSVDSGKTYQEWGTFFDLAGGYYQVLIQDTNKCILTVDSIFVDQPPAINPAIDVIQGISCYGMCDASLTVSEETGVLPYTYKWSSGQTTKELNNICPGVYSVLVTDDDGCTDLANILVNEPPLLTIESNYPEELCSGSAGSVELEIAGGTSPYQINISPGDTIIPDTLALPPGEYVIVVSDSNGCEASDTIRIGNIMPYPDPEICVVTVDTITGKNLIVWDKVPGKFIAYYIIFRESVAAGVFDTIGIVPFDDANVFLDTTIDPRAQGALYKISVVDSCGSESVLSPSHKPYRLLTSTNLSGGVNLKWEGYIVEGNDNFIVNHEIYKTHCHPPYPLQMELLAEVSYMASSYTDNDPAASRRLYQYRVAGILSGSCPVSDSTGIIYTFNRAWSQASLDPFINGCDENPPSVPQNLSVNTVGEFLVLHWDRSDDAWGIEKYNIYDEMGDLMGSTPDTFYIFTDYPIELANTFYVSAADWNYNESEKSEPVIYTPVGWPDNKPGNMLIYPNPVHDMTMIKFHNPGKDKYCLAIRDITGKVLKRENNIISNHIEIWRDNLPSGLYIIELQGPEIYRGRIVIE